MTVADLLFTEPVVFFFSLWVSFGWSILYLNFSAIPLVFSTNHNFNVEQIGAVFSGEFSGSQSSRPGLMMLRVRSRFDRLGHSHRHERVSGTSRYPSRKVVRDTRRTPVFHMCGVRLDAHRTLLVRMDKLPVGPLDRTDAGHRVRNHRDLYNLLGCLQLSGRYVSSLFQFGHCRSILLLDSYHRVDFPSVRSG